MRAAEQSVPCTTKATYSATLCRPRCGLGQRFYRIPKATLDSLACLRPHSFARYRGLDPRSATGRPNFDTEPGKVGGGWLRQSQWIAGLATELIAVAIGLAQAATVQQYRANPIAIAIGSVAML